MPRKTASRLELRKQAEAAEKNPVSETTSAAAAKKKKKATKKRTTRRSKEEVIERKRLVWVIYTATLREEARFPYEQRAEAEDRLQQLLAKGKRTYFLQPVKELLSGGPARSAVADEPEVEDEETASAELDSDAEEFEDEGDGDLGGEMDVEDDDIPDDDED